MSLRFSTWLGAATIVAVTLPARPAAQELRVGIIDFYGLRRLHEPDARAGLSIREGDLLRADDLKPESLAPAERQLMALPGVARARVNAVCCDEAGGVILFVGIEERGATAMGFRRPPVGTVRLPSEVMGAADELSQALMKAVMRGDSEEDDSNGHALAHDAAARAVQERFIGYAMRFATLLPNALRNAADETHRAVAAQVLGYAADKRSVVADLVYAMRDSSEHVRNDAMRALALIAGFARRHPDLGLRVPAAPFVDLLNSPVWTDRNKASMALERLSESRDPAIMSALRARALSALVEMARWRSDGHAAAAFWLLGRIGGLPESDLDAAWRRRDRTTVIALATAPKRE